MANSPDFSLSTLADWWSEDRVWTKKRYASITSGNVTIHEKRTSPRRIALGYGFASLVIGWTVFVIWGMVFNNPPSNLGEWIFYIVSTPIGILPGLVAVLLIIENIEAWYERHFTVTTCDECGKPVTYPHIFDEHYDIATHDVHEFCSTECRESWERENVEYEFSGYYDIQEEGDREKVLNENYSSAYYTTDAQNERSQNV